MERKEKPLGTAAITEDAKAPSTGKSRGDDSAALALKTVLDSLEDSKAEDILHIDICGKTPLSDHMVIASGRSHRHVGALAEHLIRALKDGGFNPPRVEGLQSADWILIDQGDVVVHLFRPEVRDFYNLEKMWLAPEDDATH